ncbi:MAG TPA: Cof-type HAD-IIB family hydrolase [Tepidisphaeraceae bacterium]|nr:Cof-type HAD-IIB family hydrolase [Tepidisphaeraceae bacterium]
MPPPSPDIRLIAIDLDGTLLNDSKEVSDQTLRALSCLRNDIKVVIASARPPRSVRPIYKKLNLSTWQINYNGALIWDEPSQKVIHHQPMTGPLVRSIVDLARDYYDDLLVSCEILDRWYTDRPDNSYTTETGKLFPPDVICDLTQICSQPVTKLMLLGPPATIAKTEHLLTNKFADQVQIISSDDHLLQIMDKNAGKAAALTKVAAHYQIPLTQVMAIGDALNDIGMLSLAGTSVAMHNAHPLVKDCADWIAPTNNHHGVHAALAHYGLCE